MSAEKFIQRLITVFGEPITDNSKAFFAEYLEALKVFDVAVLADAASDVIRNHNGPHRWPRIKACVEACEKASERNARSTSNPRGRDTDTWEQGQAAASRLITPAMARQAREQGWFGGLWDFVAQHRRLPEGGEIARVRRDGVENRKAMRETIEHPERFGFFGLAMANLARTMIEVSEKRFRKITGEPA